MTGKKLVTLIEKGGVDYVDRYVTIAITRMVTPTVTRFVTSYVTKYVSLTPEQIAKSVVSGIASSLESMGKAVSGLVSEVVSELATAMEKQKELEKKRREAMWRMEQKYKSLLAKSEAIQGSEKKLVQRLSDLRERVAEAIAKLTLLAPAMKEETYNFLRKYLEEVYLSLPTAQSIAENASPDAIGMLDNYIDSVEEVLNKIDEWFNTFFAPKETTYSGGILGGPPLAGFESEIDVKRIEEAKKKVEELKKLVLEGRLDQVKPDVGAQFAWGVQKVLDWASLQPVFDAIKSFARKLVESADAEPDPLKKALMKVFGHALNIGASAAQGATYTVLTVATGGMYLPVLIADMSYDITTSLSPPEREMLREALEQLKNDPEALAMIAEEFAGMAVGGALATKAPSTNVLRSMESRLRLGLARALEKLARKTNNAKLAELARKIKLGTAKVKNVTLKEVVGEEIPEAQRIEAYIDNEGNLRIVIAEKGRIKPVATIDRKILSNVASLVEQRYGINGEAFVKHLESMIRTGKLDQETATALVNAIKKLGEGMIPERLARELINAIMQGRSAYVRATLAQLGEIVPTETTIASQVSQHLESLKRAGEVSRRVRDVVRNVVDNLDEATLRNLAKKLGVEASDVKELKSLVSKALSDRILSELSARGVSDARITQAIEDVVSRYEAQLQQELSSILRSYLGKADKVDELRQLLSTKLNEYYNKILGEVYSRIDEIVTDDIVRSLANKLRELGVSNADELASIAKDVAKFEARWRLKTIMERMLNNAVASVKDAKGFEVIKHAVENLRIGEGAEITVSPLKGGELRLRLKNIGRFFTSEEAEYMASKLSEQIEKAVQGTSESVSRVGSTISDAIENRLRAVINERIRSVLSKYIDRAKLMNEIENVLRQRMDELKNEIMDIVRRYGSDPRTLEEQLRARLGSFIDEVWSEVFRRIGNYIASSRNAIASELSKLGIEVSPDEIYTLLNKVLGDEVPWSLRVFARKVTESVLSIAKSSPQQLGARLDEVIQSAMNVARSSLEEAISRALSSTTTKLGDRASLSDIKAKIMDVLRKYGLDEATLGRYAKEGYEEIMELVRNGIRNALKRVSSPEEFEDVILSKVRELGKKIRGIESNIRSKIDRVLGRIDINAFARDLAGALGIDEQSALRLARNILESIRESIVGRVRTFVNTAVQRAISNVKAVATTGLELQATLPPNVYAEVARIAQERDVSFAKAFEMWLRQRGISPSDYMKILEHVYGRLENLGYDVGRSVAEATRIPLDIVFRDGSRLIIDPVTGRTVVVAVDTGKVAKAISATMNVAESEGNVVVSRIIKEITVHKTPSGRIGNVEYQMIAEVRIPRGSSEFVRRIVNEILEAYRSRQLDELARVASKIADAVRNGRIPESVGEQLMWLVMKAPQIGQKTGVSIVPILTETDEGMNLVFAMVGSASSGAVQRALEMLREYARQANENVKQALSEPVKRGGVVIQPIAVKPRATPSKPSEGVSVPETPAKPSAEEIEKLMKAIEENRRRGEDYIKQLQALRHALREMFGDTVTADQIARSFPTLGEQLVKLLASTMGVVEVPIEVPVTVSRVEPVSQPVTKEVTAWVATSATMDRNLRLVTVPIEQVVEVGSYEPGRKEVVVDVNRTRSEAMVVDRQLALEVVPVTQVVEVSRREPVAEVVTVVVDRRNPTMIAVDRSLQLKTVYVRVPVTVGEQKPVVNVVSVEVPRTVPATLTYEGTVREVEVPVTSEVIVPVLLFNEVEIPLERGKPLPTPPSPPPPTPAPPPSFPSVPAVRYQSVPSGRPMPVRGMQMEEVVL